ncbi:MAG: zf-HC2 domain-containing protein [Armatimonadetes bacterium]|nr:zf-HC2 domain-containing protein [Armatimonadota bacterium]
MRCGTVRKWLVEFATDGIDPAREVAFRAHLDACPRCAAEWHAVESAGALLAGLPEPRLPAAAEASLLDRIQSALDEEPAPGRRRAPWLRPVLQFACVCLVAVLVTRGLVRPPAPVGEGDMAAAPSEPADRHAPPAERPAPPVERRSRAVTPPPAERGTHSVTPPPAERGSRAVTSPPAERRRLSVTPPAAERREAGRGAGHEPPRTEPLRQPALSETERPVDFAAARAGGGERPGTSAATPLPVATILTASAGAFTLAAVGTAPAPEVEVADLSTRTAPAALPAITGPSRVSRSRPSVMKDAAPACEPGAFTIDPAVLESDLVRLTLVAERSQP